MAFVVIAKAAGLLDSNRIRRRAAHSTSDDGTSFQSAIGKAARLSFCQKLSEGNSDDISLDDIHELVCYRMETAPPYVKDTRLTQALSADQERVLRRTEFDGMSVKRTSEAFQATKFRSQGSFSSSDSSPASPGLGLTGSKLGSFLNRQTSPSSNSQDGAGRSKSMMSIFRRTHSITSDSNKKNNPDRSWLPEELDTSDEESEKEDQDESEEEKEPPEPVADVDWFVRVLQHCLKCSPEVTDVIRQRLDRHEHGTLTRDQIYDELKKPAYRRFLADLRQDRIESEKTDEGKDPLQNGDSVTCKFMQERLNIINSKDQSLVLMIRNAFSLALVSALSVYHFRVWERQELQTALRDPLLEDLEAIQSIDSFMVWLKGGEEEGALDKIFENIRENKHENRSIVSSSTLVNDVVIEVHETNGRSTGFFPLHSETAQEHLDKSPGEHTQAAIRGIEHERESRDFLYSEDTINSIDMSFSSYRERCQMFALTDVQIHFGDFGRVDADVVSFAVAGEAYQSPAIYALDGVYLLLVLVGLYKELRHIFRAMIKGGLPRLRKHYLKFWKAADLFDVIFGLTNIFCWLQFCLALSSPDIWQFVHEEKLQLEEKIMHFPSGQIVNLHNALRRCHDWYFLLQLSVAASAASILIRSFKGFSGNRRLHMVLTTIKLSFLPLAHYCIIFFTVFLAFATFAHVLFGTDLMYFNSFPASLRSQSLMLFGEFGWYTTEDMRRYDFMPSGMPLGVLTVYFVAFEIVMPLLLVNMLLGIVMESYCYALLDSRTLTENPTLRSDVFKFLQRKVTMKLAHVDDILWKTQNGNVAQNMEIDEEVLVTHFDLEGEKATRLMKWLTRQAQNLEMRQRERQDAAEETDPQDLIHNFLKRIADETVVANEEIAALRSRLDKLQALLPKVKQRLPVLRCKGLLKSAATKSRESSDEETECKKDLEERSKLWTIVDIDGRPLEPPISHRKPQPVSIQAHVNPSLSYAHPKELPDDHPDDSELPDSLPDDSELPDDHPKEPPHNKVHPDADKDAALDAAIDICLM